MIIGGKWVNIAQYQYLTSANFKITIEVMQSNLSLQDILSSLVKFQFINIINWDI